MFCSNCGIKMSNDMNFCSKCGTKVRFVGGVDAQKNVLEATDVELASSDSVQAPIYVKQHSDGIDEFDGSKEAVEPKDEPVADLPMYESKSVSTFKNSLYKSATTSKPLNSNRISLEKRQIFGLSGAVLLFIGVFCPIVYEPWMWGNISLFQRSLFGEKEVLGDGVWVLILAVITAILTLVKKYKGLWITGLVSMLILVMKFIDYQKLIKDMSDGYSELDIETAHMQWGWALLIIGNILVLISAAIIEKLSYDSYRINRKN